MGEPESNVRLSTALCRLDRTLAILYLAVLNFNIIDAAMTSSDGASVYPT